MAKVYAALGDSMSIDVYAGGPGRGAASLLHTNLDGDFPEWAGRDLRTRGYDALDLTRDGATTSGVLNQQLPHLDRRADLVTITMGGNDLMTAYGDSAAGAAAISRVTALGDEILERLRPMARTIVLTTVYDPSDGTGAVPSGVLPPWPDAPRLIGALNSALSGLAERHGALLADVHAHFLGHGSAAGDPSQPHPRPGDRQLWYCGIIEPNAWGAHQIRHTWWRCLERAGVM